jgi:hypothetical protein
MTADRARPRLPVDALRELRECHLLGREWLRLAAFLAL